MTLPLAIIIYIYLIYINIYTTSTTTTILSIYTIIIKHITMYDWQQLFEYLNSLVCGIVTFEYELIFVVIRIAHYGGNGKIVIVTIIIGCIYIKFIYIFMIIDIIICHYTLTIIIIIIVYLFVCLCLAINNVVRGLQQQTTIQISISSIAN